MFPSSVSLLGGGVPISALVMVLRRAYNSKRRRDRCVMVTDRAAYSDRSGDRCVMVMVMVLHEPITVLWRELRTCEVVAGISLLLFLC